MFVQAETCDECGETRPCACDRQDDAYAAIPYALITELELYMAPFTAAEKRFMYKMIETKRAELNRALAHLQ